MIDYKVLRQMKLIVLKSNDAMSETFKTFFHEQGCENLLITDDDKMAYQNIEEHLEKSLIIIDWNFDFDKAELIKKIKKLSRFISIIAISDADNTRYEIQALNANCDDFVYVHRSNKAKLLRSLHSLIIRIEVRFKFGATNTIQIEDLIIDPDEEKIIYLSKEVELKGKPFEVLTHLAKNRDQIVSKEQLLDSIWEEPEIVTPNVIEVAINQIRQKLDKPLGITTIETIRRRGYKFSFPHLTQDEGQED